MASAEAAQKRKARARKSPSGYWELQVKAETPPAFGETFRPGRTYVVADQVLAAIDDELVLSAEHHLPPAG